MTKQTWEYRAQVRGRYIGDETADWADWTTIETRGNRHGRNAYKTLGAARGIISREKREAAKRASWSRWNKQDDPVFEWEYRVQRRPVSDGWETV